MPQRHEGTKAEWIEISLDETLCLGACLSVQAGICGKKLSENFCRAGNHDVLCLIENSRYAGFLQHFYFARCNIRLFCASYSHKPA